MIRRAIVILLALASATLAEAQGSFSNLLPIEDGQFAILRCDAASGSSVRLSIITLKSREAGDAVLAKLRAGEAFAAVAKQYSTHPTNSAGGALSAMDVGDVRKDFQDALKELGPCADRNTIVAASRPAPGAVSGASGPEFVITDEQFIDRSIPSGKPSKASVQVRGGKALWDVNPDKGEVIEIISGEATLWGEGSVHTWVGDNNDVFGHVISSDRTDPLQFRVDSKRGYVYLRGRGTIKLPTGEVKTLPVGLPLAPPESAAAMRICAEAGIDITRKRIWDDKQIILRGLTDAGLRTWLEAKR